MARTKIITPSISIGGQEFKCKSRSISLTPGDFINFCEQEWTLEVEIEISYGADGSWNLLQPMIGTVQEIILSPSDTGGESEENPTATFDAEVIGVPFMSGAQRGERQTFSLTLMAEEEPVFSDGGS